MSDRSLSIANFEEHLAQTFQIKFTEEIQLPAVLESVTRLDSHLGDERESFSVIFSTGQEDQYYSQSTVILVFPDHQKEYMFLVPIGLDKGGKRMCYEAIFN